MWTGFLTALKSPQGLVLGARGVGVESQSPRRPPGLALGDLGDGGLAAQLTACTESSFSCTQRQARARLTPPWAPGSQTALYSVFQKWLFANLPGAG